MEPIDPDALPEGGAGARGFGSHRLLPRETRAVRIDLSAALRGARRGAGSIRGHDDLDCRGSDWTIARRRRGARGTLHYGEPRNNASRADVPERSLRTISCTIACSMRVK